MKVRDGIFAPSLRAALGISCVLGLLVGCGGAEAVQETSNDGFAAVTGELQQIVDDVGAEGASLLLVQGGEVVYDGEVGTLPDGPIPIASSTKWLSAVVVMTLVDDGRLSLDDTVSDFLPPFEDEKGDITVGQLLSHTSGLPRRHPCLRDRRTTLEACAEQIGQADLEASSGTQFAYGGASMQVAGRIAEVAAGQPWAELVEERLTGPLGMSQTVYGRSDNPIIAGGAVSTPEDYACFLQMLLDEGMVDGRRVLSEEAIDDIASDRIAGLPAARAPRAAGGEFGYGLGVWLDESAGDAAARISSPGLFGSYPWIDRERDLASVFFPNTGARKASGFARLHRQVNDDLIPALNEVLDAQAGNG